MIDDPKIMPFGKHKGQPLEALAQQNRPYLEWLSTQEWFRHRYSRCRAAPGAPVLDDSCISKIGQSRL
jgi:hypothetical protein